MPVAMAISRGMTANSTIYSAAPCPIQIVPWKLQNSPKMLVVIRRTDASIPPMQAFVIGFDQKTAMCAAVCG